MIFFVGVGFVIGQFVRVKTIVTPQDPEVLYTEAYRHYEASADNVHRSSVDKSINFCRLALDLDPDYENAYRLLGNIHMKRENYIEALACWKKLQDIHPHQVDINQNLESKIKECIDQLIRQKFQPEEVNGILASEIQSLKSQQKRLITNHLDDLESKNESILSLRQTIKSNDKKMVQFQKTALKVQTLIEKSEFNSKQSIVREMEKLSDSRFIKYKIKRGDTFSQIATMFKVSVEELCELNNISDPHKISPGDTILINVQVPQVATSNLN